MKENRFDTGITRSVNIKNREKGMREILFCFLVPIREEIRYLKNETMFFSSYHVYFRLFSPLPGTAGKTNGLQVLSSPGEESFYFTGLVHAPDPSFHERDDEPDAAFKLT
jgi:hypothetical protein